MSFVSFQKREITFKLVYYGPPLSGKTTNLELLHKVIPATERGDMTMLSTRQDRTLYFDFLPLQSNAIKGFVAKFQLYTVPGQPIYTETRRIVLNGVDGVVFVADSQWSEMEANTDSFENLKENLATYDVSLEDLPHILQFNKRDLPEIAPIHYLEFMLNRGGHRVPSFESVATDGTGIRESLNAMAKLVMARFIKEHKMEIGEVINREDLAVSDA
jgi:signal recognition particle receptor subunit beta